MISHAWHLQLLNGEHVLPCTIIRHAYEQWHEVAIMQAVRASLPVQCQLY